MCKGKWIKTTTGRKQKLTFSLGKLNNQTVTSLLDYGFSTAQTQSGSCGLKVWICFKPKIIKKRF
jgi:ribosomal protein S3